MSFEKRVVAYYLYNVNESLAEGRLSDLIGYDSYEVTKGKGCTS